MTDAVRRAMGARVEDLSRWKRLVLTLRCPDGTHADQLFDHEQVPYVGVVLRMQRWAASRT